MNFADFIKELAEIVDERPVDLLPERALDTVPMWDSTAIVSFMAMASDKRDLILDPEALTGAKTVEQLFALVA